MEREVLVVFQGKNNVIHIRCENGTDTYLTQSHIFTNVANSIGACALNTVETKTKHVLFLFNGDGGIVGKYYMGKKLQGKTPEEILSLKDDLIIFESWNPTSGCWVPCISLKTVNKEGCGLITIFKDGYYRVEDIEGNIIIPTGRWIGQKVN